MTTFIYAIFFITGTLITAFFLLFFITSVREKTPRSAIMSLLTAFSFGLIWFGIIPLIKISSLYLLIPIADVIVFTLLFLLHIGKTTSIVICESSKRVDERDMMFAREEYLIGTEKYDKYYAMRPDKKKIDDKIRKLPRLLESGGRFYEPAGAKYIQQLFSFNESMLAMVDGDVADKKTDIEPEKITSDLKSMTLKLGAGEVGMTLLNPKYIYSNVGRGIEPWGAPIVNNHKFAIAFTLEMDFAHVEKAPHIQITEETAVQYMRGATISIKLAEYIRSLGYPARAHIAGSNYQIMLPAVANDAGLGELGRHGYLISKRYGARIRLGAVTTDIPLATDKPIKFGVQEFCTICKKCADNCPSHAIPFEGKTTVRGVEKWQLNIENCITYWRVGGTDCGLCMKVCPFSHPPAFVHDIVRKGIKNSVFARLVSLYGDDIFYGRKVKF
jgi:reductive dehalogenase